MMFRKETMVGILSFPELKKLLSEYETAIFPQSFPSDTPEGMSAMKICLFKQETDGPWPWNLSVMSILLIIIK